MTTEYTRIVLRARELDDTIVHHPGQPADYVHIDGTVWTWHERWRLADGARDGDRIACCRRIRMYDLLIPIGDET